MDKILKVAEVLQAIQYLKVASLAVFLHDYLVTFELEVEHIWKSKLSIAKVIYLITRYLTFIDVPLIITYSLHSGLTPRECRIITFVSSYSVLVGIAASQAILILRTYALWDRSKGILFSLILLWIGVFTSAGTFLAIVIHSVQYTPLPLPFMRGCFVSSASKFLYVDYMVTLIYETIIMFLTLWVGVKRYRHSHNRLVTVLYRDGILYFMCLFMITCSYTIVLITSPPEYLELLYTPHRVMHSILGTRIILQVYSISQKNRIKGLSQTV